MNDDYLGLFNNYYKKVKEKIEKSIKEYNETVINIKDNKIIKDLLKEFTELNSDGKYIRGSLIAIAYNNYVNDDGYLPLAVSYEAFETAILIHDDITDKGKTRRGKKTIHEKEKEKYIHIDNKQDIYDFSNSQAMWIGNLAYYLINKNLLSNYKNSVNLYKIINKYNDIVIETIKGEIIDINLPFISKYNGYLTKEEEVLDIYKKKTAKYTILGPFELGLSLLGKDISINLREALENIGICFQIKDDILGVFGDSKVMGKPNISDIEEFKQTILYTYTINTEYRNELLKYYGHKITETELEEVRKIFINSNALEYAETKMKELINVSINNINHETDLTDNTKKILKGLIDYIEKREK